MSVKSWEEAREKIFTLTNSEDEEFAKFYYDLIKQLVNRRKELGMSQRYLAFINGTERTTINQYENFYNIIKLQTLHKLCKSLGGHIKIDEN